jgi:type I restriction enzyme M protein
MGAANILRGMIDAADFKQYILPLLFFKRISDVWDEEYEAALEESDGDITYAEFRENHWFDISSGCHWKNIRSKSVDVGKHLQNALRKIDKADAPSQAYLQGTQSQPYKKEIRKGKIQD